MIPSDLSNLKLWLKADGIKGLIDGAQIPLWQDDSGQGNSAAGSGSVFPLYKVNVVNGQPAARFSGANGFQLDTAREAAFDLATSTIFVVAKRTAGSTIFSKNTTSFGPGDTRRRKIQIILGDLTMGYSNGSDSVGGVTRAVPATISGFAIYAVVSRGDSDHDVVRNGDVLNSVVVFYDSVYNDARVEIGQAFSNGAERFTGDIAEVIVYSGGLSNANRAAIEGYLFTKYNIAVPVVSLTSVTELTITRFTALGTVSSAGDAAVTERGFVVSRNPRPTTSDTKYIVTGTTGALTTTLTGLVPGALYYVRGYALNSYGTAYSQEELTLTTDALPIKHYIYRIFDEGTYIETWTKEVLSEPTFRSTINGGSGQLMIELGRPFDDFGEDFDVKLNNRVECWVVDRDAPNGLLLYTGYISAYRPIVRGVTEKVEITVLGYIAEFQRIILRDSSGNTTLAYNSYDPAAILRDVIDKLRVLGCSIMYTSTSIQNTNTSVTYEFNTNTGKEALDKIVELCPEGWYWRVDSDGIIYLRNKNIEADHIFSLGLQVEELETLRRIEDVTNRVFFVGAGDPALFKLYENSGSVDSYGPYEKKIVDQRVSVAATASTIASRQINQLKDPEIRSTFTIIDNNGPRSRGYDIESVKPGQTLKVKNLNAEVASVTLWDVGIWDTDVWDQTLATSAADVIQILSVDYRADSIVIEASSRLPQIAKRIEDIQRNLEVTQMLQNPAAPT